MTPWSLLAAALAGLLLTGFAATATKVLHAYSRLELQRYCRRRNRPERFGQILDEDAQVVLGTESLQAVGAVLMVLATGGWLFGSGQPAPPLTATQFLAAVIVATLLLLAATSWIPSAVVQLFAEPFLYHAWRLLRLASMLLWPLSVGVAIANAVLRRLADRPESEEDEEEAFEDEIRSIVTEGLHEGLLEEEASEMIENVMELGDDDVSDIMTPRSHIDAMDIDWSWPEMLKFVVRVGRTRIPVYEKTLDNVVGVLYVKDLLGELSRKASEPRVPLRERLRKPWFVPQTKPLDDLLQEFLQTRNHLAVVVDEYRSVAGVVTIEDVLEEIVGEIVDESDKEMDDEIQRVDGSTLEVVGTVHIDTINERLGLELPEPEEFDTVAGLLIRELGRIPKPGDSLDVDGATITVLESSRRKVERLRVKLNVR